MITRRLLIEVINVSEEISASAKRILNREENQFKTDDDVIQNTKRIERRSLYLTKLLATLRGKSKFSLNQLMTAYNGSVR